MTSPLSFSKAWCFTVIMFWLQAVEEGDDYGFYYLLEFSTRAREQLWLRWQSIYIAVFSVTGVSSYKKRFIYITVICKCTLIKSTGTWSHSQKGKKLQLILYSSIYKFTIVDVWYHYCIYATCNSSAKGFILQMLHHDIFTRNSVWGEPGELYTDLGRERELLLFWVF